MPIEASGRSKMQKKQDSYCLAYMYTPLLHEIKLEMRKAKFFRCKTVVGSYSLKLNDYRKFSLTNQARNC